MGIYETLTEDKDLISGRDALEDLARLNAILAANEEVAFQRQNYHKDTAEIESLSMRRPVSSAKAYSLFGVLFGSIPTLAILCRTFFGNSRQPSDLALIILMVIVSTLVTAGAGFLTGSIVSKAAAKCLRSHSLHYILLLPLIGAAWGLFCGFSGGIFIFIVGAIVGGAIGAVSSAAAFPLFALLHHNLQKNGFIELNKLLPVALGISLTAAALVFGL